MIVENAVFQGLLSKALHSKPLSFSTIPIGKLQGLF
jgi:hypothetical protein